MYARSLPTPTRSVFLFGPRGTGKTTWIRDRFPTAAAYDLLDTREALRLSKNPDVLFRELAALPAGSWAVIDEVQKVPELLNEVHRLIEARGLRFVLSGSSARKLRRRGVNLLAGRAITTTLFPLVSAELDFELDVERALSYGTLPMALVDDDPLDYLRTYAETYLVQEVQAEALTRNLGAFARFLEIAARQNAQATNATSIARDAGIDRRTVQNHFAILTDTLIGYWLPAWKLKSATKQVRQSKFYFFDGGVVRALSGRLPYPPTLEERGPLVETLILNEIRAFLSYTGRHYRPHYWRSYDGAEVDVLCETAAGFVAIEIKAATRWDRRFNRGLHRVRQHLEPDPTTCFGIYLGQRAALWDDVRILPVLDFLKRLWDGDVLR
ncbi:MAG: AAA family ATPase [Acidobacteriota bacterium]|nr:AAA family ATPase [Acidobacteriota bacterium]